MPVYPSGGTIAQSVGSPGFGPAPTPSYNASASVRFNTADSANMTITPSLQGSRTTWTWSNWVKRSSLGVIQYIASSFSPALNYTFQFQFQTDNTLEVFDYNAGGSGNYVWRVKTTQVFRDPASWYHIQVSVDTTQATAANRVQIYVNGVLVTALAAATYPTQYYQTVLNTPYTVYMGSYINSAGAAGYYLGAYLADMNFVDGLALTPSSFTATDANTGQLVPAQYTGNRGTNGFYLPFSGAALAADLGQNPKTTAQDYPYWPYSTLLVNTTSTNGAQNNTFLDSSTNNFTVTRNGNTTQGNFSPFTFGGGTTQANGYYSGYFDGTGDYLITTGGVTNAGTGDVCVEAWVYYTGTFSDYSFIFDSRGSSPFTDGFNISVNITNGYFYLGQAVQNLLTNIVCTRNTWFHVCATRQSGVFRLFVNGVLGGTYASSSDLFNTTNRIGASYANVYFWNGIISNLRAVRGSVPAQYQTSSTTVGATIFLPPTTPLTAIANTSLLTCQSSQFIDNSANAFAITANGNSQPLPTNPFGMTDWSNFFDGTGDYLTVPSATATTLDADFTIEYFMYRPAAGNNWMLTLGDSFLSSGIETYIGTSGTAFNLYSNNAVRITSATLPAVGAWSHVAMVRSGSTVTLYLNGVSLGTWTSSATFSGITYIGAERYNGSITGVFTGYLSNVRIVKGTALYTANFTPPTAPLTAISGTSLLTCQSSTFVDNSTNAFAITVNGNPYTLTLNNPFNSPINYTTPPVQSWSNYFDGTGDYLSTTVSAAQVGTGDFTIEFFCYLPQALDANDTLLSHGYAAAAFTNGWYLQSTGTRLSFGIGSAAAGNSVASNVDTPVRRWFHFAITRVGSLLRVWQDGLLTGSMTNAQNGTATSFFTIASASTNYYCTCNISNLRIIKGQSIYNANFTVPTSPLTAVQNTSLLTCQSNTFVDNSITNATVTKNGDALISSLSPFIPTQAWSAASYGGSMYFDGTGDYLTVPSNAAFDLGSGNATIETWIYPTTSGQTCGIFDKRSVGTNYSQFPQVALVSGAFVAYVSYSGSSWAGTINGATPAVNTWTHVAFVRNGNTWTLYVNGVISGTPFTAAGSVYASTDSLVIGASTTGGLNPFRGYISNARILKGTALYTTPFVPPVLPPTAIANTSLLLNATNSGIYDATGQNVIETVGNAQVSTAVKKWGTSSMYFDGTGDWLFVPTNANFGFGTGAFTVEAWVYPATAFSTNQTIVDSRLSNGATPWLLGISTTGLARSYDGTTIRTGGQLTSLAWNHVAWSRTFSGLNYVTVNGVVGHTWSAATDFGATKQLTIGSGVAGFGELLTGYIQDLRITKGAGRYSGSFTPPAAAFAYNQYDIGNQQWTPGNISVTAGINQDNLVDSPSDYGTDTGLGGQVRGNYATLNPLNNGSQSTLSNGNLDISWSATAGHSAGSTIAVSSGKWYAEFTRGSSQTIIGIIPSTFSGPLINWPGNTAYGTNSYGYFSLNGNKYNNSSPSAYGASYATGDVIGVALDLDAGTLVFYKNGVSQGVAYSSITGSYIFAIGYGDSPTGGTVASANFGQRAFAYAAPAGFKCLVSTNLPTPTIGTTSSTRADDYFNTVLWTGNGSNPRSITGVGFQPDMVWSKTRSQPYSHGLYDAVRGAGGNKRLYPNETYPENGIPGAEGTVYGSLTSFDSDGFSVNAGTASNIWFNANNETYVAWNWKANGAGVANTDGTIPSTVSANTTSGCSIVTYTGNGSASQTVGHGLGIKPSMIILKDRNTNSSNNDWWVAHVGIPSSYIFLNTTAAAASASATSNGAIQQTNATSSVITFTNGSVNSVNVNESGDNYVAYCFAEVSGFSKFGTYTGNGSAEGPFVFCNFEPMYVLIKESSAAGNNWRVFDGKRNTYNVTNLRLSPSVADAEATETFADFVSNGFKIRTTTAGINASGSTFIFAAFAEFPFKYSRAR